MPRQLTFCKLVSVIKNEFMLNESLSLLIEKLPDVLVRKDRNEQAKTERWTRN